MKLQTTIKIFSACFCVLIIFLLSTNPSALSPIFLTLPFLLLFLCLFLVIFLLMSFRQGNVQRNLWQSALLAAFPVILVAMQSLGQLSWRDAITILFIFTVIYVYLSRFASRTKA